MNIVLTAFSIKNGLLGVIWFWSRAWPTRAQCSLALRRHTYIFRRPRDVKRWLFLVLGVRVEEPKLLAWFSCPNLEPWLRFSVSLLWKCHWWPLGSSASGSPTWAWGNPVGSNQAAETGKRCRWWQSAFRLCYVTGTLRHWMKNTAISQAQEEKGARASVCPHHHPCDSHTRTQMSGSSGMICECGNFVAPLYLLSW